ncbi:MAG: hypothetical protein QOI96_1774 [Verrucomicrobiota bacterium]
MKTKEFANDAEVATLVAAFETATIPPSQFTHVAHMAVALSYLDQLPLAAALARMREKLLQFTAHNHLVDLYHETLTTFWMRLLDHVAQNHYQKVPLWRRINLIVARWGTAAPVEAHYSRELIKSKIARENWTPPDRLPIPF